MASVGPPRIFSRQRRIAALHRMAWLQEREDAARFVFTEVEDDLIERLSFLRHRPQRTLLIGWHSGELVRSLEVMGCAVTIVDPRATDPEEPCPGNGFDFIASLFALDAVNDLPGALIHLRQALAPGGLAIAALTGSGSLPMLRHAMLAADGDRPAPRLHPQIDVRAGGQLLQRAGFADPVVDSQTLRVRYGALGRLVDDLRAQGLGNVLADPGPSLFRSALARAEAAFASNADQDGRVTETIEILTLSGWRR